MGQLCAFLLTTQEAIDEFFMKFFKGVRYLNSCKLFKFSAALDHDPDLMEFLPQHDRSNCKIFVGSAALVDVCINFQLLLICVFFDCIPNFCSIFLHGKMRSKCWCTGGL